MAYPTLQFVISAVWKKSLLANSIEHSGEERTLIRF